MELTDVRRLTGPSLLLEGPGAAAEAVLAEGPDDILALWQNRTEALLAALGWAGERVALRRYDGGATLALSAPADCLYAATELLEAAWQAALDETEGRAAADSRAVIEGLAAAIAEESNPQLLALAEAARARGLTFLEGEDLVSVGLGGGCLSWPADDLPPADAVDWTSARDIPVALVTGTNGKSTTVRMTAAIGAAAGRAVGLCSSDWVKVAGEIVEEGDYSGPGGARRALRDPRSELAVIEVARGGLMRRGLTLTGARACLITNVAADHLGEYGIVDLASLAEAKFLLARAVAPGGCLILNADDPLLVEKARGYRGRLCWIGLDPVAANLDSWVAGGGAAAFARDGALVLARDGRETTVVQVADVPVTLKGAARFNVANALGAIALAAELGLPVEAMAAGLAGFGGEEANPGRLTVVRLEGVTVLVDFAHNPHGVAALIEAMDAFPAQRRLFLLGQAGDRRDEDIAALTEVIWRARPQRVIVKEMVKVLRGRAPGEVPALIARLLAALGAPADIVSRAETEIEAVRAALDWAEEGDLLVLLVHTERKAVMALLRELEKRAWRPGESV